jgi:cysteine desulfurase
MGIGRRSRPLVIRFGIGRFNTERRSTFVADLVIAKVNKLRDMSPLYEMHKEGIDLASCSGRPTRFQAAFWRMSHGIQ